VKICAIRGCNLASLHGAFKLDLERGPLGSVGLFLISGPTGAGKSTLLDAMCLALYGKIPRLEGARGRVRGSHDIDELTAKDVRSILRRDQAKAWAEVEFVAMNGGRFCARWEVRRARDQATGALQPDTHELHDLLAGTLVFGKSDKKTVTRAAIEDLVGLTFEQFRRSALLAQGDFAAFLRSPATDRAQLLERMTGTEIYADLSIAAFERNRSLGERSRSLHDELRRLGTLSSEDRARLEAETKEAGEQRDAAASTLDRVKAARSWEARRAELERALADAKKHAAEAAAASEPAWAAELRRNQALGPLRPLRDALRRGEKARATCNERVQVHDKKRASLAEAASEAASTLKRATRTSDAFAAERVAAEAALAQARSLDQTRLERTAARDTRLKEAEAARSRSARLDQAAQEAKADFDTHRAATRTLQERVAALAELGGKWPRLEGALRRLIDARVALGTRDPAALEAAAGAADKAERAAEACRRGLNELDAPAIRQRRAELDAHERYLPVSARIHSALAEAKRAEGMAAEARKSLEQATMELAQFEPRRQQARTALKHAEAEAELAFHRADLVDGEPCPLCGSPEHPLADHAPLAGLVGRLRKDLEELERQVGAAANAKARAEALIEAQDRRAREARLAAERAEVEGRGLLDALVGAPLERAVIDAQEAELRALELQVEQAHKALGEAESGARSARLRHTDAQRTVASVAGAAQQADVASTELIELLGEVPEDPVAAHVRWGEQVRVWTADTARVKEGKELLDAKERAALQADRDAVNARQEAEREAKQAREGEALLGAAVRERNELLGGRATDEVAAELQARIEATDTAWESARRADETARSDLALQARACQDATQALSRTIVEVDRARAELSEALAARGLTAAELDAGLTMDGETVRRLERELAEARRARTSADAVVGERTQALEVHSESEPPERPSQTAEEEARATLDKAEQRWLEVHGRLAADDRARASSDGLRADLADLDKEAAVWRVLSDCIGSAKGGKFREFAQGLTLQRLVAHANEQLRDLAPRYELMRVPDEDLEIQVRDLAMADEVRTVASLSGGETFLVSLALALGLASMSSDKKVESLFIDEGFGALDQKSLETAIATLEALERTGRKVGVISHVQALADQIGVQVRVEPESPGRSRLRLPS